VAIVGIADPGPAADAAMRDFGAEQAFADAATMLDATKPDGVIVATPGRTHVAIATAALARNVPVLLEKPVGMTAAEAAALIAAEAKSEAFVLPGHILRFSAPYREMVGIVKSGALGRVLAVSGRKHRDDAHAVRYPDVDPVLMTLVHDIDLMLWATGGTMESVYAVRNPPDTFRSVTVVAGRDSTGAAWNLSNAWIMPGPCPPDRVEITCERGSVEMEVGISVRVSGDDVRLIDVRDATDDAMLDTELAAFLDGIRAGTHPGHVTLQDARNGLAIADAIARSLETGMVETVG
jgi:predicted dehydrogenase